MAALNEFISQLGNEITCIYGPAGTGKTTFAVMMALDFAKKGKKVYYIDTENGCNIERVKEIAGKDEKFLEKIFFTKATNFQEQCEKIRMLDSISGKFGLVIIDTIGHHYRNEIHGDVKEVNNMMADQLDMLSKIAKKDVAVLITNQVSVDINTNKIRSIGGDFIKKRCKKIIELEKKPRKMIVLKPFEKEMKFEINNSGIELV